MEFSHFYLIAIYLGQSAGWVETNSAIMSFGMGLSTNSPAKNFLLATIVDRYHKP